jgi:endonuclease/exonuclease/phosphatase family metal-dependent hydrolase
MKRLLQLALIPLFVVLVQAQDLVVYTANVQHGQGTDGNFDFSRQVAAIADADLVAVQERTDGETGWDSPLSSAGLDEAVFRENHSSQNDGPAIWYRTAKCAPLETYQTDLQVGTLIGWDGSTVVNKAAVGVRITCRGRTFYFFSAHLCWSACADSNGAQTSAQREGQLNTLVTWINGIRGSDPNVIVGMDGNFSPTMPKLSGGFQKDIMAASYTDLWTAGISASTATANWGDRNNDSIADMPVSDTGTRTHDTRRIDWIWKFTTATLFSLRMISVPDLRATCPHALVAGGNLPSCSPEVTGGPGVSGNQWDVEDDFGVEPTDHNLVRVELDFITSNRSSVNGKATLNGRVRIQ